MTADAPSCNRTRICAALFVRITGTVSFEMISKADFEDAGNWTATSAAGPQLFSTAACRSRDCIPRNAT